MHLYTSNSQGSVGLYRPQRLRSLLRTLLVSLFFLVLYWTLVIGGVIPSSEGINQRQIHQIKAGRYIYSDRDPTVVRIGPLMMGFTYSVSHVHKEDALTPNRPWPFDGPPSALKSIS